MAVKKRKVRKTPAPKKARKKTQSIDVEAVVKATIKEFFGSEVRVAERDSWRSRIADVEVKCGLAEKAYTELSNKLVRLLTPEQRDAAKICGVTPEMYALEWIELARDRALSTMPAWGIDNILRRE